ncbi:hypothetical protein CLUG_00325 [Clavispora lusitaniae ATCC 42720]|uniref:Uncharacterized protein n=1 Tax=Clavispora lusitaniae (strain ATCC 42720) TaxID=306902 RepID=C4XWK2_CLAL4|nr:uncharacterized protein CLUG_00325 [Clavispora lusitaniae ATCC 42720]EEQ36202.1 hypothetical protein CLUG_00325 [Clavispora lusitaniae ATCC 42720]
MALLVLRGAVGTHLHTTNGPTWSTKAHRHTIEASLEVKEPKKFFQATHTYSVIGDHDEVLRVERRLRARKTVVRKLGRSCTLHEHRPFLPVYKDSIPPGFHSTDKIFFIMVAHVPRTFQKICCRDVWVLSLKRLQVFSGSAREKPTVGLGVAHIVGNMHRLEISRQAKASQNPKHAVVRVCGGYHFDPVPRQRLQDGQNVVVQIVRFARTKVREKAVAEAPRLVVSGEVRNIVEPHYKLGPPVVGRVDFPTVLAVVGIFLHHVPVHHGEFFFDAFKRER